MAHMALVTAVWISRATATAATLYYLWHILTTNSMPYGSYVGMAMTIVAINAAILVAAPRGLKTIAFGASAIPFAFMAIPMMIGLIGLPIILAGEINSNGSIWSLVVPVVVIGYGYATLHTLVFAMMLDIGGGEVWHVLD